MSDGTPGAYCTSHGRVLRSDTDGLLRRCGSSLTQARPQLPPAHVNFPSPPDGTYHRAVTTIAAVHGAVGHFGYDQADITAAFSAVVSPGREHHDVIERIHRATGVERRHLAIPLAEYVRLADFGAANDTFIRVGLDLAQEAITGALDSGRGSTLRRSTS